MSNMLCKVPYAETNVDYLLSYFFINSDAFPHGNRMPATNIPVSAYGPVPRYVHSTVLKNVGHSLQNSSFAIRVYHCCDIVYEKNK